MLDLVLSTGNRNDINVKGVSFVACIGPFDDLDRTLLSKVVSVHYDFSKVCSTGADFHGALCRCQHTDTDGQHHDEAQKYCRNAIAIFELENKELLKNMAQKLLIDIEVKQKNV